MFLEYELVSVFKRDEDNIEEMLEKGIIETTGFNFRTSKMRKNLECIHWCISTPCREFYFCHPEKSIMESVFNGMIEAIRHGVTVKIDGIGYIKGFE